MVSAILDRSGHNCQLRQLQLSRTVTEDVNELLLHVPETVVAGYLEEVFLWRVGAHVGDLCLRLVLSHQDDVHLHTTEQRIYLTYLPCRYGSVQNMPAVRHCVS